MQQGPCHIQRLRELSNVRPFARTIRDVIKTVSWNCKVYCKDCIIQDRKAHEKCEAYALVMLVYMKIEKGAEGRQNTVLVHLGSSLKSKIISFLLIKKDFKIIVVAFFELRGSVWRMRFLKNKDFNISCR